MRIGLRLVLLSALIILVPACSGKKGAKTPVDVDPSPVTVSAIDSGTAGHGDSTAWGDGSEATGSLSHVYFDFDRYELRPEGRDVLAKNAEYLKKNPAVRVVVEGHCDEFGTSEYNLSLGELRAQSTKKYLVSLGVSPDRIDTISYGKEKPLCREGGNECWAQNRRAHFLISAKGA